MNKSVLSPCSVELKCPDCPNPFPRSLTPSLHRHICSPHRRNYVSKAQSDDTLKQQLTLAIALLYRIAACWTSQCTLMLPSPQGTTTRVLPKHTVTFIVPTLLRPSRIQGKLGIKGSSALMPRSLIIFGSAPWRLTVSYNRYPFRFIAAAGRCVAVYDHLFSVWDLCSVYGNRAVFSRFGSNENELLAPSGGGKCHCLYLWRQHKGFFFFLSFFSCLQFLISL